MESGLAHTKEMAATSPKKLDDPESPHRPRLTAEQTAFLEEYFAHTPRPSTMQKKKHAEDLGLTQEKVNNWFQNRRAKSKQQNKTRRELSILTPDDPLVQHYLEQRSEMYASKLPTSPLQYSELAEPSLGLSHDLMCGMPSDQGLGNWPLLDAMPHTMNNFVPHHHDTYAHINAAMEACAPRRHPYAEPYMPDGEFSSASSAYQESIPEYAFAPSTSTHSLMDNGLMDSGSSVNMQSSSIGTPAAEPYPSQILLQEPLVLPASGQLYGGMVSAEQEQTPQNLSLRLQAATNSVSQGLPLRSPSPVTPNRTLSIDSSRRGSNQSDMNNIQHVLPLQRPSPRLAPESDSFKTPELPDTSLASRRKRQRPANLISMRAVSASTAAEESPRAKTATLPTAAVRRIKSTGHNLNMFPGRVQKSASQTPLRSPMNLTFFENLTREENSPYPDSAATSDSSVTMQTASYPELQQYPSHSWTTSPSSLGAPALSASYTQNSFEESIWMASPPITPFFPQPANEGQAAALAYLAQLDYPSEVPQSAPAHLTAFDVHRISPPSSANLQRQETTGFSSEVPNALPVFMSGLTGRRQSSSHAPRETPFFQPQPLAPAPQLPSQIETTVAAELDSAASQHHGLGQYTFLAAPQPPPQKELEIVMANFPSPVTKPLALPTGEFTFQNSGPADFGESKSD